MTEQTELYRQNVALAAALKAMLEAYAWNADETAKREGEESLHSAVRQARQILRELVVQP